MRQYLQLLPLCLCLSCAEEPSEGQATSALTVSPQPAPSLGGPSPERATLVVAEYLDAHQSSGGPGSLVALVEDALATGDGRAVERMHHDLFEFARTLPPQKQTELDRLLVESGQSERVADPAPPKSIEAILQRGKILSEDEYRLLQSRAEQIWDDPNRASELAALNKLLATY